MVQLGALAVSERCVNPQPVEESALSIDPSTPIYTGKTGVVARIMPVVLNKNEFRGFRMIWIYETNWTNLPVAVNW